MEAISILCTAIALSAAAGFRAFVPLFGLALLQRSGAALPMAEEYAWLSGDAALFILAAACVLEVAADKIPLVDNVLDSLGVFVRPVAGTTAVLATTSEMGAGVQIAAAIGAVLLSGGIATAKAAERGASTATTGGLANPVLSLRDDAIAGTTVLAGFALPLLVPVLLYVIYRIIRATVTRVRAGGRRVRDLFRRRGGAAVAPEADQPPGRSSGNSPRSVSK